MSTYLQPDCERLVSCLDGPDDVPRAEIEEARKRGAERRERRARTVGYSPPIEFADAVSKAMLALLEVQWDYAETLYNRHVDRPIVSGALKEAARVKDEKLQEVLDLLYGARNREDGQHGE